MEEKIFDHETKALAKWDINEDDSLSHEQKEFLCKFVDDLNKEITIVLEMEDGQRLSIRILTYKIFQIINSINCDGYFMIAANNGSWQAGKAIYIGDDKNLRYRNLVEEWNKNND